MKYASTLRLNLTFYYVLDLPKYTRRTIRYPHVLLMLNIVYRHKIVLTEYTYISQV